MLLQFLQDLYKLRNAYFWNCLIVLTTRHAFYNFKCFTNMVLKYELRKWCCKYDTMSKWANNLSLLYIFIQKTQLNFRKSDRLAIYFYVITEICMMRRWCLMEILHMFWAWVILRARTMSKIRVDRVDRRVDRTYSYKRRSFVHVLNSENQIDSQFLSMQIELQNGNLSGKMEILHRFWAWLLYCNTMSKIHVEIIKVCHVLIQKKRRNSIFDDQKSNNFYLRRMQICFMPDGNFAYIYFDH